MIFASIMYQSSNSKGQELLAQRMVKFARRLGVEAWYVTSIYHDGNPVVGERDIELTGRNYVLFERDPYIGLPTIRVASFKTTWPPRRIVFRDFVTVLNRIDREIGLDFIVTHSTLWNGPEDAAKWILWKKLMKHMGENVRITIMGHMSHYQPPDPQRYSLLERTYRMAWNAVALPSVFKAASIILVLTPVEGEDMITLGASLETIHLFPGGLDDDTADLISKADPTLFRDKYKIPSDAKIVSYMGTVEYRKNPLAVVKIARAFRNRRDVFFVIAGRPGDQWEEVVLSAKNLGNVVITGELSEEEKASLIKASYLNIIMSRMEAFGLTQLEFMYGGVPVITSAVYGQKWLVRDGIDGVHVRGPEDIEGAVRAIENLLRDEDRWCEMSRNARERAGEFLFSKLIKSLFDRVKTLLEH
ncbi:glycosyltransferase family 4 protein [Desulfurococcus amylolyticus]|uniref:Glycosyl transferase group 1 n=1 Tax=Desulfurococcus amylolyticus DSM 16532 TaxID=768672 RepID=I3XSI8_DESAM|nr:glycosyltransferase family 4 protein [Desulfurococcus amylolyticus]AFL66912.1 glycosyl transferase group 1 [Desulfurococcus amylolyticus DSM 16532]